MQRHLCSPSDDVVDVTGAAQAMFLRNGVEIDDPLGVLLGFLEPDRHFEIGDPSPPESFGEVDLRMANRDGARISSAQIAEESSSGAPRSRERSRRSLPVRPWPARGAQCRGGRCGNYSTPLPASVGSVSRR